MTGRDVEPTMTRTEVALWRARVKAGAFSGTADAGYVEGVSENPPACPDLCLRITPVPTRVTKCNH